MRKEHAHDVLSDRECVTRDCHKKLKLRLVETKPNAIRCFTCHRRVQKGRGHPMTTAREVRTGEQVGRIKGRYGIAAN